MVDNDFPTTMSGNGFLTSYLKKFGGNEQYSQSGTDIPTFSVGKGFVGGEGTGIPPYFMEEVSAIPAWGGSPQQNFTKDVIEKLNQPGSPMPEWMRRTAPTQGPKTPGESGAQQAFGLESRYPEIAQGIPVGQDPLFPMTQEDFRETVNRRLDDARLGRPYTLSPELQQRIQSVRSRFGIGSV
jgi:hypothetical protein